MTIIDFSEWLQAKLDERDWSGNQLAVKAGIDRGIISRALNRERMPSPESLKAIAHAFGLAAMRLSLADPNFETVQRLLRGLVNRIIVDRDGQLVTGELIYYSPPT